MQRKIRKEVPLNFSNESENREFRNPEDSNQPRRNSNMNNDSESHTNNSFNNIASLNEFLIEANRFLTKFEDVEQINDNVIDQITLRMKSYKYSLYRYSRDIINEDDKKMILKGINQFIIKAKQLLKRVDIKDDDFAKILNGNIAEGKIQDWRKAFLSLRREYENEEDESQQQGSGNEVPGDRDEVPGDRDEGPGDRDEGPGDGDEGPGDGDEGPGDGDDVESENRGNGSDLEEEEGNELMNEPIQEAAIKMRVDKDQAYFNILGRRLNLKMIRGQYMLIGDEQDHQHIMHENTDRENHQFGNRIDDQIQPNPINEALPDQDRPEEDTMPEINVVINQDYENTENNVEEISGHDAALFIVNNYIMNMPDNRRQWWLDALGIQENQVGQDQEPNQFNNNDQPNN